MKRYLVALCAVVLVGFAPLMASATTVCNTCLTANQTSFEIGDPVIFYVTGMQPNTDVYWSFNQNSEQLYTHEPQGTTDSSGNYTWNFVDDTSNEDVGNWLVSVDVGNANASANFVVSSEVSNVATFDLKIDKTDFTKGEEPFFTITGAPASSAVYVSNTLDGEQRGEEFDSGVVTDTMGNWFGTIPDIHCECAGLWTTTLTIGGSSAFVSYYVGGSASDGGLWKFDNSSTIYYSQDEILYPFTTYYGFQVFSEQNTKTVQAIDGVPSDYTLSQTSAEEFTGVSNGNGRPFVSGTLVKDHGTIFLIMDGENIPFANMQAFLGLGYLTSNVIEWDLSGFNLKRTNGIFSSAVPHTWGSWVVYKTTVYYSDESGMVPISDFQTFTNNHGIPKMILQANQYDIEVLNENPNITQLINNDPRVAP